MSADKKKSRLSKAEITKFRETLLEKRQETLGDVTGLESQALRKSDDEVSVDHMADHGSDSYEKDQTIGLIERESEALKAIEAALEKIKDGTFGLCEACEGSIKKARLKALPYARLCLECKMLEEKGEL